VNLNSSIPQILIYQLATCGNYLIIIIVMLFSVCYRREYPLLVAYELLCIEILLAPGGKL